MKNAEYLATLENIYNLPASHRELPTEERLLAVLVKQQVAIERLQDRVKRIEDAHPKLTGGR